MEITPLLLAISLSGTHFFSDLYLSLPAPEFSAYGITAIATHLVFLTLCGYCFSKVTGKNAGMLHLNIVLLSTWPLFDLCWPAVGENAFFGYWHWYGDYRYAYIIFNIWKENT